MVCSNNSDDKKQTKKSRCSFSECKARVAIIVGDCTYCDKSYCVSHRLPEGHQCEGITKCRDIAKNKISNRLLSEKAVSNKI